MYQTWLLFQKGIAMTPVVESHPAHRDPNSRTAKGSLSPYQSIRVMRVDEDVAINS